MYLQIAGARETADVHLGRDEPAPRVTVETPARFTARLLSRVVWTTQEPFRYICRIHVRTTEGGNSFGSGVLISRYHVLTCAHVLYPRENPHPIEVTVLPGQNGPNDQRPRIRANGWAVSPGWRWNNCMTAGEDFGIIRLARPSDTGFWPIESLEPSRLRGAGVYLAGYPSRREDIKATWMYRSQGHIIGRLRIDSCTEPTSQRPGTANGRHFPDISDTTRLLAHSLDTGPSMSGGPMWIFQAGRRVLVALHAGDIAGGRLKKAILLNPAVRRRIGYWMSRALPPLPR
jgi:V8-like Glu-specific endopeptidase